MASSDPPLAGVPWELPHTFLGLDDAQADFDSARAVVLPVPYESTTSYGGGTREGPRAILEASRFVELYDEELASEPARIGIHTLPALELSREGSTAAMAQLEEAYGELLGRIGDRFPVMLGGEHSLSAPAIRAVAARRAGRLSVLQLDAHADLRDGYEGAPWSHASFAFRCLDVADFVQVGIRAMSSEEAVLARDDDRITSIPAREMVDDDTWMERALGALGSDVYLTFDVDYFDPAIMPATGTPEPGGGEWYRTLRFLRRVFSERNVVAMDVVELAPLPGVRAPDFLTARLVYKLMGYRFAGVD